MGVGHSWATAVVGRTGTSHRATGPPVLTVQLVRCQLTSSERSVMPAWQVAIQILPKSAGMDFGSLVLLRGTRPKTGAAVSRLRKVNSVPYCSGGSVRLYTKKIDFKKPLWDGVIADSHKAQFTSVADGMNDLGCDLHAGVRFTHQSLCGLR